MADRKGCREAAGTGGPGAGERLFGKRRPLRALWFQVLLEPLAQKLFPERISTSGLLPESLKAPPQPLLLPRPMKSPPAPAALPGAKREVLRQSRAGSGAAGTHFILSASVRGSCAQKNRSLRLSPRPLTHPACPPSTETWKGPCLKPNNLTQVGPVEMEAIQYRPEKPRLLSATPTRRFKNPFQPSPLPTPLPIPTHNSRASCK